MSPSIRSLMSPSETGSPEAILEASELLEEHFEKYRAGRLAARREALRRQIR